MGKTREIPEVRRERRRRRRERSADWLVTVGFGVAIGALAMVIFIAVMRG
jgi:ABC-type lipoprotein release transport system permease subunit